MKRLVIAASVGTILVGTYSLVYACKESHQTAAKVEKVTQVYLAEAATAPRAIQIIDDKAVCKTLESIAPITIEVDVPAEAMQMTRVIHIRGAAVKHPETEVTAVDTVKRTAKVAATLGRAFVTTVGAVFGSLVDAAVQATSSLV